MTRSLDGMTGYAGRGERIRTSDSYVPNVVLYQAELRPDRFTEQILEGSRNSEEA